MQGKGVVKFFLVVMVVVTLVQFFYNIPIWKVETAADDYANSMADSKPEAEKQEAHKAARSAFLDSVSSEEVFKIPLLKSYSYQDLKSQQLALGLDLKGGMSLVLQVDLREFIRALANDSKDPTFVNALEKATQDLKSAQSDYVTLFGDAWQALAGSEEKLNKIFRRSEQLEDINGETSNGEVIRIIRTKANETVSLTFNLLKQRIDKLGVAQPNVSLDESRDLIVVELPGIDNPERARNFMQAAAKLEFWKVYRLDDAGIRQALTAANEKLRKMAAGTEAEEEREILRIDSVFTDSTNLVFAGFDTSYVENTIAGDQGPLFDVLLPAQFAVIGTAERNKIKSINEMLSRPGVKELFPKDLKFLWSQKPYKYSVTVEEDPDDAVERYALYAINLGRKGTAPLGGDNVTSASANPDATSGEMQVSLAMNQEGSKIWARLTQEAVADNREIAIVLDDEVVSAPAVQSAIMDGRSSITGNFTTQEGQDLANILEIGKLPAGTEIIQESLVGPSLGADNIRTSIQSMVIGLMLVLIFMVFYYGGAGIVSIAALFMNLFFIFGALASIGTVLTLPGIAGIILTIGMAVDANVIIYERVREELREGKSTLMAIQDGFNNSYSAIIDANVTTILTAIVLAYFGLGPIKGFAVVLIVGVLSSLFTAVLLGRMLIDWWTVKKGNNITFWTGATKNSFANVNFDWLGKRKIAYTISGAIILAGLTSTFMRGFDLGVDFKGGYSYNVEFEGNAPGADEIRAELTNIFEKAPVVKAVDSDNTYNVVTDYLVDDDRKEADSLVMAALYNGINNISGGNVIYDQFRAPEGNGTHVSTSSKVGPTIADDITKSSYYAAIFALLLIFLYIFIRFSRWQYSMGAVAALFHDVMIVLAIFSLGWGIFPFAMEIDQAFIAAILTVIGYSINDTVVVFDRIREFMTTYAGQTKEEIINKAVNSTISRTIITSLTTLFVVLMLFIFGGGSIKGFAFALLIGIIVGTYSSVFIATPVMSDLTGDLKPKETKTRKSFSRAAKATK